MTSPPTAPVQTRRKARTRAAILAAADELFRARGFAATSTREIAAKAGVGEGTMYGHFASKEEILREVLRDHTRAARDRAVERLEGVTGQEERIRIMLRGMAEFCADERDLLLPSLALERRPRGPEPTDGSRYPLMQPLVTALRAGIDSGEFVSVPVESAARALLALYQAAAFQIGPWSGHFERTQTLDDLDAILRVWLRKPNHPSPFPAREGGA